MASSDRAKVRSRKDGAAVPLDDLDRKLLNLMQGSFPLDAAPVRGGRGEGRGHRGRGAAPRAAPARRADHPPGHADLRHARARLRLDARRGEGRRRAPVAARRRSSTRTPASSHNYLRNHEFNMWFTIAVEEDSTLGLQGTLDVLAGADRRGVDPPAADAQALQDPHGPRDGGRDRQARQRRRGRRARAGARRQPYDERDVAVIRATQGDLPVVSEPYAPAAAELGMRRCRAARAPGRDEGARPAAPRRRDPLPPPRRLQRERHGRLEGARGPHRRDRPAHGRLPRHQPLLPAPDLRGLAVLGLHDGPRPLEGGVRRDPRRDRRRRSTGSRTARRSTRRPSSRRSGCCTSRTSSRTGNASTAAPERPLRDAALRRALRPSCEVPARRGELAGARDALDRPRPALRRARPGAEIIDVDGNRYVD